MLFLNILTLPERHVWFRKHRDRLLSKAWKHRPHRWALRYQRDFIPDEPSEQNLLRCFSSPLPCSAPIARPAVPSSCRGCSWFRQPAPAFPKQRLAVIPSAGKHLCFHSRHEIKGRCFWQVVFYGTFSPFVFYSSCFSPFFWFQSVLVLVRCYCDCP